MIWEATGVMNDAWVTAAAAAADGVGRVGEHQATPTYRSHCPCFSRYFVLINNRKGHK